MTPGRWLWHDDEQFEATVARALDETLELRDTLEQLKAILHCWFDFEDGYWLDDGTSVPGHTCMLEDNHDGPHEPTSDIDIHVEFKP